VIAATAPRLGVDLVSEDKVFRNVPDLTVRSTSRERWCRHRGADIRPVGEPGKTNTAALIVVSGSRFTDRTEPLEQTECADLASGDVG
jgi:hypothetical protein